MDFEIVQRLPVPRPQVEAAFVDERFLRRLGDLPKLSVEDVLGRTEEPGGVRLQVRYRYTAEFSSVVTRVIDPSKLTWVEDSLFRADAHRTDVAILPDHYADRLRASMRVDYEEAGTATVRRMVGAIRVSMPLVGRRVEAAIVTGFRDQAELAVDVVTRFVREAAG